MSAQERLYTLLKEIYSPTQAFEVVESILGEHEQKVLAAQAELRHQLNIANLKLQKSEALRELLEQDFHGVKATQQAQKEALRAIAGFVVAGNTAGEQAVKNTLKGLEL